MLGASGGSATLTVGPLTNRGTIELTTADGNFQTRLSGAGPVTNAPGSSIHVLPGTGGERHLSVPTINQGTVTLDYPLYLDNAGLSQLNDVGGTIDASNADLVLTQNAGSSFTNQGTMTIGATRTFSVSARRLLELRHDRRSGHPDAQRRDRRRLGLAGVFRLARSDQLHGERLGDQPGLLVLHGFNTFNGGLTNQAGATVRNFQGNTTLASAVSNHGTIELTSTVYAQSNLIGNGTLTNEADGQIHVLVGGGGGERHLAVPTTNRGTVSVQNNLYPRQFRKPAERCGRHLRRERRGPRRHANGRLTELQQPRDHQHRIGAHLLDQRRHLHEHRHSFRSGSLSLASLTANLNTLHAQPDRRERDDRDAERAPGPDQRGGDDSDPQQRHDERGADQSRARW